MIYTTMALAAALLAATTAALAQSTTTSRTLCNGAACASTSTTSPSLGVQPIPFDDGYRGKDVPLSGKALERDIKWTAFCKPTLTAADQYGMRKYQYTDDRCAFGFAGD